MHATRDWFAVDPGDVSTLSASGAVRRAAIAELARAALRRRRHRRLVVRAGLFVAAVGCVIALVLTRLRGVAPPPAGQPTWSFTFEVLHTPPDIAMRLACQPSGTVRVELLDDRDLIEALAEAGHSAGLVRCGGRLLVVPPFPGPAGGQ